MSVVQCTKCAASFEYNTVRGPLPVGHVPVCHECDPSQGFDMAYGKPPANLVLRALDALRVHRVACEDCGAGSFGNAFCLRCLRWQKRMWREKFGHGAEFLRVMIKMAARGLYREYDRAES